MKNKGVKFADGARDFIEKLVELAVGAVFLWMLFIGIYAFIDAHSVTASGELGQDAKTAAEEMKTRAGNPLDGLKEINSEIIGWVTIDETHIDHPVLQTKDNTKYLTRDYTGKFGTSGAAFVDYRNNKLEDPYSIIYGHRMKDGLMFSDITKYAEEGFFRSHLSGAVYTENGKYDAQVVGFAVLNVASTEIYAIEKLQHNSMAAYNAIKDDFMYASDATVAQGDKLVLLSTCDKDARFKRDVLLLKLTKS